MMIIQLHFFERLGMLVERKQDETLYTVHVRP